MGQFQGRSMGSYLSHCFSWGDYISQDLKNNGRPKERFTPIKLMNQRIYYGTLEEHGWRILKRASIKGLFIGAHQTMATVSSKIYKQHPTVKSLFQELLVFLYNCDKGNMILLSFVSL